MHELKEVVTMSRRSNRLRIEKSVGTRSIDGMIFLLAASIGTGLLADLRATEIASGMQTLSLSFRRLEKSIEDQSFEEILDFAGNLGKETASLQHSRIMSTAGAAGEAHLQQIQELSKLLRESAQVPNGEAVVHHFEQLRHACVSCHVTSRPVKTLSASYPAKGKTLVIDVKVSTIDGKKKADHSNVVVFLDGIPRQASAGAPLNNPTISQRNRDFSPRILPIVRGTTVSFPNDDTILHNVFSISKTRQFDLDVYQPGKLSRSRFQSRAW
jgi:hypothetical protein